MKYFNHEALYGFNHEAAAISRRRPALQDARANRGDLCCQIRVAGLEDSRTIAGGVKSMQSVSSGSKIMRIASHSYTAHGATHLRRKLRSSISSDSVTPDSIRRSQLLQMLPRHKVRKEESMAPCILEHMLWQILRESLTDSLFFSTLLRTLRT